MKEKVDVNSFLVRCSYLFLLLMMTIVTSKDLTLHALQLSPYMAVYVGHRYLSASHFP